MKVIEKYYFNDDKLFLAKYDKMFYYISTAFFSVEAGLLFYIGNLISDDYLGVQSNPYVLYAIFATMAMIYFISLYLINIKKKKHTTFTLDNKMAKIKANGSLYQTVSLGSDSMIMPILSNTTYSFYVSDIKQISFKNFSQIDDYVNKYVLFTLKNDRSLLVPLGIKIRKRDFTFFIRRIRRMVSDFEGITNERIFLTKQENFQVKSCDETLTQKKLRGDTNNIDSQVNDELNNIDFNTIPEETNEADSRLDFSTIPCEPKTEEPSQTKVIVDDAHGKHEVEGLAPVEKVVELSTNNNPRESKEIEVHVAAYTISDDGVTTEDSSVIDDESQEHFTTTTFDDKIDKDNSQTIKKGKVKMSIGTWFSSLFKKNSNNMDSIINTIAHKKTLGLTDEYLMKAVKSSNEINTVDKINGWTPLMVAIYNMDKQDIGNDVISIIIDKTNRFDTKDCSGWTAYDYAKVQAKLSPENLERIKSKTI